MPRKSTASVAEDGSKKEEGLSVEDLNLPKSIVQRLAKGVLPANTQIQKDAQLAMSKSATVFVNYLTAQATETANHSGKKTVTPTEVYAALRELEFDFLIPRLSEEVDKYTSIQADKRNTYRKKVREERKAANTGTATTGVVNGTTADIEAPPAKRARRSSVDIGEHASGGSDEEEGDDANDDVPDEDEEVDDDEVEEEPVEEGLTEDPIEVRESEEEEDEMADGDVSD